jgi:KTSC domain
MHAVDSSAVAAIGYDPRRREAYVEYVGGGLYAYADVSPRIWREFEVAESKGGFVNLVLKPGRLYRQVRGQPVMGARQRSP